MNCKLFSDSKFALKVSGAKTKSAVLIENVFAPHSIERVLEELKLNSESPVFFSIATDASNKGNRKLFPIAIKYFDITKGLRDRILDSYKDSHESAIDISNHLNACLDKYNLNINNVSSFSADNAPVNYGKKHSVYQKLTDINPNILKSNCNAHIVHNAGRHACKKVSYDVENLIPKV